MINGRSQQLRRNQTEAERQLWNHLRNRQLVGHKFRRQVNLGAFVVDFICFERKLILELDGGQHGTGPQSEYDEKRTEWLEAQGYYVLRFWNNEVLRNMEGVLNSITERLKDR